jgi:hypothetical protein
MFLYTIEFTWITFVNLRTLIIEMCTTIYINKMYICSWDKFTNILHIKLIYFEKLGIFTQYF